MSNNLPSVIAALTADGLALLMGQPTTATLSQLTGIAYQNWLTKKANDAHQILFDELLKGGGLASDVDPDSFFGLLHRYLNATKQGAARRNLRLMAQVLKGSLSQDCGFTPDVFATNADLVASLSRDEIKFLATYWKMYSECLSAFEGKQIQVNTQAKAKDSLVPTIFSTEDKFRATAGALTRTGLIVAQSAWGGIRYDATPRLWT